MNSPGEVIQWWSDWARKLAHKDTASMRIGLVILADGLLDLSRTPRVTKRGLMAKSRMSLGVVSRGLKGLDGSLVPRVPGDHRRSQADQFVPCLCAQ